MTYHELFAEVKSRFSKADVSAIGGHLAYQFNITGEGDGIFYVELKVGMLSIEPYEYYDRDVIFTCSAKTLLKIADGKQDPIVAFTLQKLKVDGSIDKALKLKDIVESCK